MNTCHTCRRAASLLPHASNRLLENEAEGGKYAAFAKLGSSLCLNCYWCNRTSKAYNEDNRLFSDFRDEVAETAKS